MSLGGEKKVQYFKRITMEFLILFLVVTGF